MKKYLSLLIFLIFFQCTPSHTLTEQEKIVAKTCDYLWSMQKEDGSWRSELHGLLKGGQAYTPFILYALLQVNDSIYPKPKEKINKALAFIRQNIAENGAMGKSGYVLEYPNYATAYSLLVLAKIGEAKDKPLMQKMQTYLIEQQFDESRGIAMNHPAYGSWGFGETRMAAGEAGHADLSHTRRILEALQATNALNDSIRKKARIYLAISQKNNNNLNQKNDSIPKSPFDGGFYYSTVVTAANKAKQIMSKDAAYYPSYATATCDGVLSLLACGLDTTSMEVNEAQKWLLKHPKLNYPEGIPTEDKDQWYKVMVLYHLAVRAEAYEKLKIKGSWQKEMFEILKEKQAKNGSFANLDGARNKENDPLLGSAFALTALLRIF